MPAAKLAQFLFMVALMNQVAQLYIRSSYSKMKTEYKVLFFYIVWATK